MPPRPEEEKKPQETGTVPAAAPAPKSPATTTGATAPAAGDTTETGENKDKTESPMGNNMWGIIGAVAALGIGLFSGMGVLGALLIAAIGFFAGNLLGDNDKNFSNQLLNPTPDPNNEKNKDAETPAAGAEKGAEKPPAGAAPAPAGAASPAPTGITPPAAPKPAEATAPKAAEPKPSEGEKKRVSTNSTPPKDTVDLSNTVGMTTIFLDSDYKQTTDLGASFAVRGEYRKSAKQFVITDVISVIPSSQDPNDITSGTWPKDSKNQYLWTPVSTNFLSPLRVTDDQKLDLTTGDTRGQLNNARGRANGVNISRNREAMAKRQAALSLRPEFTVTSISEPSSGSEERFVQGTYTAVKDGKVISGEFDGKFMNYYNAIAKTFKTDSFIITSANVRDPQTGDVIVQNAVSKPLEVGMAFTEPNNDGKTTLWSRNTSWYGGDSMEFGDLLTAVSKFNTKVPPLQQQVNENQLSYLTAPLPNKAQESPKTVEKT